MKITIIRHTAVASEKGICYGQSDVPLAESFNEEKALIQQKIGAAAFDRIYCSPLQRCRKLAESIFSETEIIFDKRLKELDFGDWENQQWDRIFQSDEGKEWFADYFHRTCPGGESYGDLVKRIQIFFAEITSAKDENVCIVTHGGPLKIIKALVEKRSIEEVFNSFNPAYGEIIQIEMSNVEINKANQLRPVMFVGTGSDVGKSIINAAFCRIFKQDGYSPAPFKAQNMSLNSFAGTDGLELGRAQAVQAEACGIEPCSEMNPILLKPTSNQNAQVVLNGKPIGNQSAKEYFLGTDRDSLFAEAMKAYDKLARQYNPMVIEGAGSISEINLREKDITNMRVALDVNAAVFLIADIDRGGVFGSVYGTMELLPPEERKLIKGIIINKFRGDIDLFKSGKTMMEKLCKVPVVGIIPYFQDIYLEDEDSVVIDKKQSHTTDGMCNIAVVLLRHMSNFTDFNVLERTPGVHLFYSANASEIEKADVVIIPGSKNSMSDLVYLREKGLAKAILKAHEDGKTVLGICGGYQIMGSELHDPKGVEGETAFMPGLGILPVSTTMQAEKRTIQSRFSFLDVAENCQAYEIHMGETELQEGRPLCRLSDGRNDGCLVNEKTWGTYLHGIFDNPEVVKYLLEKCGKNIASKPFNYQQFKEEQYNKLAAHVRANCAMETIYKEMKNEEVC